MYSRTAGMESSRLRYFLIKLERGCCSTVRQRLTITRLGCRRQVMQLQAVLRIIYAHEKVIGIDITGECSATLDYFSELEEAEINNEANEELLRMILEENHP